MSFYWKCRLCFVHLDGNWTGKAADFVYQSQVSWTRENLVFCIFSRRQFTMLKSSVVVSLSVSVICQFVFALICLTLAEQLFLRNHHMGCPVVRGNKWIANKWVKWPDQMWNYPCNSNNKGKHLRGFDQMAKIFEWNTQFYPVS